MKKYELLGSGVARDPLSKSCYLFPHHTYQTFEELYVKIPHTSRDHVCEPQIFQQKMVSIFHTYAISPTLLLKTYALYTIYFYKVLCTSTQSSLAHIYITSHGQKFHA